MGELICCVTSRTSRMRKGIGFAQRKIEWGREIVAPSAVAGHAGPANAPSRRLHVPSPASATALPVAR